MLTASRAAATWLLLAIVSVPAYGRQHEASEPDGGPFTRAAVLDAPFSANAITRVRETLPDGTIRDVTLNARYYRDSLGRVRAELDTAWGPQVVLWIPGADRGAFYAVDPASQTYRLAGHFLATALFNGEGRIALPVGKALYRYACPVLDGSGRERLAAVHAEVSPDLHVVVASHRFDHFGSVDLALTDVNREEPPSFLFEVPQHLAIADDTAGNPLAVFEPWDPARSCSARK